MGSLPCSFLGGSAFFRNSTKKRKDFRPFFGSVMGKCKMEWRKRNDIRNSRGKNSWAPRKLHSPVRCQKTGILSHRGPKSLGKIPKNPKNLEKVNAGFPEGIRKKFDKTHFSESGQRSFGEKRKGPGHHRGNKLSVRDPFEFGKFSSKILRKPP